MAKVTDEKNSPLAAAIALLDGICTRYDHAKLAKAIALIQHVNESFPFDEWHEDDGPVLWWHFPIESEPYCGRPDDSDWRYGDGDEAHLRWTRLSCPVVEGE